MAFIKFINSETLVQASVIPVTNTIVRIETETEPNISGFVLYLDEEMNYPMSNDEYMGYTTLYRQRTGAYELSNDGSVWVEDVPEPYVPTVTFFSMYGTLESEKEQHVTKFEDLVVPEVKLEEGFNFIKWEPEIPPEGDITEDMVFHAIVQDKNIYFHCSGGGTLEGETKQFADNYSKLVVPTTTPNDNFKFVGWKPEVPKNGVIAETNFYAVFESNIPDRIGAIESDLTDAQMGLVENYDLATAASEEVTELQLALVEVYNLISGGEI